MEWDEAQQFPLEIVPKMAEMGILGAIIPPDFSGAGLSYPEYVIVVEELSRIDGSMGFSLPLTIHSVPITFISSDRKNRNANIFPIWRQAENRSVGNYESGPEAMREHANHCGKRWKLLCAQWIETFHYERFRCRDLCGYGNYQPPCKRHFSISIRPGYPGAFDRQEKKRNWVCGPAIHASKIILEDCRIPGRRICSARKDKRFSILYARFWMQAESSDCRHSGSGHGSRRSYEHCLETVCKGKTAISAKPYLNSQVIRFKLADMATEIDAARLLTLRAATLKQQGKTTTRESSMAKLFSGRRSGRKERPLKPFRSYGGYGFIKDFPVEKILPGCPELCTIGEGYE